MSIDFRSDPIGQRVKGWKQPPRSPRTRLVPGWEPRPGAGQEPDPDLTARLGGGPTPEPEVIPPYDWGAIRATVFPEGLGPPPSESTPEPTSEPTSPARSVEPDPGLTAHLGGKPVAKSAASVYDPSQARTLSSSAPSPASKPPARPPAAPTSAQAAIRAASGGAGPRTSSQQEFVSTLLPKAQEVARQTGIPWQVLVAIPANETGWGSSVFHNNYFGIKGPGAAARTWEVINGKRQDITDSFRTFDSPEASMKGFAELMQNPRYSKALEQIQKDPTNWPAFVSMIHTAGYATDPQWAQKVISIGQGLESADSQHFTSMSKVTPTSSLMDVARSPLGGEHPSGGTSPTTAKGGGGYVFPVQGYSQVVPDHWGSVKGGSDLFAPRGTPVMAMRGGTVIEAGVNSVGGNSVMIKGDDGLEYYYAHGDAAPSVKTGQKVEAGTFLMPLGDSGNAKGKGTHLHIGIGPSIREGADKYGGTGGDYDAVGLMNSVLKGGDVEVPGSKGGGAPATKGSYTDDASYVAWAYRNGLGRNLPSTTSALYVSSKPIKASDAQPGDLVMFNMNSRDPNQQHVAMYTGDGKMIHNNDGSVREEPVWGGAQFRRLSGVKASDLAAVPGATGTPSGPLVGNTPRGGGPSASVAAASRILKYVDNNDGTWTAHHADGTTEVVRTRSQAAPVEGGRHPSTFGAHPSNMRKPGAGQDEPPPADPDLARHLGNQTSIVRGGKPNSYWTSEGTHGGHPAADIFADPGTPIYAPASGTATPTPNPSGGNAVIIQGDDGKYYYMAHGKVPFQSGPITVGQQIGQVGNTGNAKYTDSHVHVGVASDPSLFDKYGGSGDIEGGPEYWGGAGQEAGTDVFDQRNTTPSDLTPLDTYYHGTPHEFESVDPDAFWGKSALYGPGYYLTDSPSVAGGTVESGDPNDPEHNPTYAPGFVYKRGYAHKGMDTEQLETLQRQLEKDQATLQHVQTMDPTIFTQFGSDRAQELATWEANLADTKQKLSDLVKTQPNVRQIGVPKDLKFFDLDHPLTPEESQALASVGDTYMPNTFVGDKGTDAYMDLLHGLVDGQGWNADEAKDAISAALEQAGYDGIAHIGGGRTGTPPHNVKVIFPERLGKVKNLLSGEWGGSDILDETLQPKGHVPGAAPEPPVGHVPGDDVPDTTGGAHQPGAEPETPKGHVPGAEPEAPKGHVPGEDVPVFGPKPKFPAAPPTPPKPPGIQLPKLPGISLPTLPGMPVLGMGQEAEDDPDPDYSFLDTPLSTEGEARYQIWKAKYAPRDSGYDYDLRGAYKAKLKPDPETGHWPDTYKKPNHPTFSNQSQFAKDYPDKAGHWDGDTYVPPADPDLRKHLGGAGQEDSEEDIPWWDRARRAAEQAAQGVGDVAQGVVNQITAPAQLAPDQQPATETLANAPEAIGGALSQLGTSVRDVFPEEEEKQRRLAQAAADEDARQQAIRRKPIAPVQGPPAPPTPPEQITPTSPLPDLTGQTLTPAPPPEPSTGGLPKLEPTNPIMQAARGEPVNPLEWNEATGRAITQTVVPEPIRQASVDLPVIGKITGEDVGAQVLSPASLINVAAGGPAEATALSALGRLGQGPVEEAINLAAAKLGSVAVQKAAPLAGKVVEPIAVAVAERAEPLARALVDSPVSKFLLEESGAMGTTDALKLARNELIGTQAGGIIGVVPDLRNPRVEDPDWWAQVQDDYASGAKVGAVVTMGIPGARYGLEKTITPTTMRWFNNVFNPRASIPDAAAQVAAGTRANTIHKATQLADIVGYGGRKEFGKAGTGLNTAEAAAYAETNRTLVGFVAKDGVTKVTPAQEAWLQERLAYEDAANARLTAAKVLGPTQNVVTSGSLPGPKVHITHLFDQEVAATKQAASRGRGFGWRDSTIIKPRDKTIDPSIDPNTPRTIRESIDEWTRDKLTNPKPLDDLVSRFEVSAYQTERTLANRNFYSTINPPGKARLASPVVRPAKLAPDDWVRPKDEWGLGPQAKNFRFEPNLATYMDNVSGAAESAPWLEWFGEHIAAPAKGLLFGGSAVHAFNVTHRVNSMLPLDKTAELFRSYIMPAIKSGYGEVLLANPGLALEAAENGLTPARYAAEGITPQWGLAGNLGRTGAAALTGGGAGWTQAKARGESDEEALHQAFVGAAIASPMVFPGVGKGIIKALGKDVDVDVAASFADVLHHAIFREGMPAAKLGMYDILTRSGVDKEVAATSINNTIGGIDQMKMGRSPWVQDLMRYGLIAGDWTEGQVKTMANMFMPNQMGAHTRSSIAKGLGSYMAGIEGLNLLLNGHPTWENGPGNEFKLEITGALNGAAYLSGNPDLGSVDPTDKTPTRTFVDPMPPLRWMMETVHEAAREGVYTMGQAEQAMGNQAAGQRLMDFTGTNLEKGELPPNLGGKLGQDIEQRIGPGPSILGAAKEFVQKKQQDWTGAPLDPPDLSTPTGWATWIGHMVAPFAPATATSVLSNVDVAHPSWRTYGGDAWTEFLGFTRVNRNKELSRNLSAVDKIKTQFLGIDPAIIKKDEEDHQQRIAVNDKKRADLFASLPSDTDMTHGDADKKLHSYNDERKADTRRQEIWNDFASKVPEGPLRDTIQRMFENAWNVPPSPPIEHGQVAQNVIGGAPEWARGPVEGAVNLAEHMWNPSSSPTPADLNPTTDIAELANAYWLPPGVDVTNTKALNQARNNLLRDFAVSHNEDPEALQDWIKWNAQRQDDLSKATPPPPSLPNVTSGQLGQIATNYLQSGEDEHGQLIEDVNVRGDKMRAFLKDNAQRIGVTPDILLQRINLRLSPVAQQTPLEKSYNTALQTFFESRDQDKYPAYLDENGAPLGDRAKWDIWNSQINSMGLNNARKFEEWQPRVEAKERAEQKREQDLLKSPYWTDYQRWFGIGRGQTERAWRDYVSGNATPGYEDLMLDKDLKPPKDETLRRDKIQAMYRASNLDQRIDTEVWVWVQGDYVPMNLNGASKYIRTFQIPSAGRRLEDLAAYDEASPNVRPSLKLGTVGAEENG